MGRPRKKKDDIIIVKKYANRRLYDTGRSSYVTLDDLAEMIREGQNFVVQDAKTGKDLTQSVLTQIIVEKESREDSEKMLPESFLKQIIQFYGDSMQSFIPDYLESSMQQFMQQQEQFREQFTGGVPGSIPGAMSLDEMNRQGTQMMQQAMQMMAPFTPFPQNAEDHQKRKDDIRDKIRELEEELKKL